MLIIADFDGHFPHYLFIHFPLGPMTCSSSQDKGESEQRPSDFRVTFLVPWRLSSAPRRQVDSSTGASSEKNESSFSFPRSRPHLTSALRSVPQSLYSGIRGSCWKHEWQLTLYAEMR